ncbi:MAG: LysM peptidoglycan-binding domain-containing protein, partial [Pseudomonadota bacterium]
MTKNVVKLRLWGIAVSALALAGCGGNNPLANFDLDLRSSAGTLDTSAAAQNAGRAPQPDGRGIISYPGYQVAVAKRGDTLQDVADRLGLSAQELSSFNALPENVSLRQGEIIALPRRVREPDIDVATSGPFDVSTLAGNAIDRAESRPGVP